MNSVVKSKTKTCAISWKKAYYARNDISFHKISRIHVCEFIITESMLLP